MMPCPDRKMYCMYTGAGSFPVAGRQYTPVKLHHVAVRLTTLGHAHGLGVNVLRAGNALVMLHTTFRANIL
jgi:hypothetical protein